MELDGTRIRNIRHRLGLTQAALSEKAGYAARTIQRAEAGEAVKSPTAAHIAQALNVRIDEIMPRSDGPSFVIPQDPLSNEVTLVHCLSGRQLHGQLSKTTFLEIERDFEPRREQREALHQFGTLVEGVWQDPWLHPLERPNCSPSESDIFDQMIEAGEILEALSNLGLKVMGRDLPRQARLDHLHRGHGGVRKHSIYSRPSEANSLRDRRYGRNTFPETGRPLLE